MNIVFVSCGNDSVALLQWCVERGLPDVHAVYSNTGWAHPDWPARVDAVRQYAQAHGMSFHEIKSEGMTALVKRKKAWPRQGIQFCTQELKIKPAIKWMDERDPDKDSTCLIGVRREESANRAQFPEHVEGSDRHGGRDVWAPLVRMKEDERNALILRAGFDVLPHRSMECNPCINANRADLRKVPEAKLIYIENLETDMGHTKEGKPRTMFRPYRHQGATGIREVIKWADAERGKYKKDDPQLDLLSVNGDCAGGWCGG